MGVIGYGQALGLVEEAVNTPSFAVKYVTPLLSLSPMIMQPGMDEDPNYIALACVYELADEEPK